MLSKSQVATLNGALAGGSGTKVLKVDLVTPEGRTLWNFVKEYRDEDDIIEGAMRGGV